MHDRVWRVRSGRLFVGAVAVGALMSGCGGAQATRSPDDSGASSGAQQPVAPVSVSAAKMKQLPKATTYAHLRGVPTDPAPSASSDGLVVHPQKPRVVYARPGGPPVAVLPTKELGSPTWVPVVQTRPGWQRVLLPSRPNRATGWIYTKSGGLESRHSSYVVRIKLGSRSLTVLNGDQSLGTWTVAVGAAKTPTPTGRTFVLASLAPAHPTYSPLILPLGAHSNTLDTFGGGPGTVGLHGWPEQAVFGHAISHGCVRVPDAALDVLSRVPLGSLVQIMS